MRRRDLGEELGREDLRDRESRRRAREKRETFTLFERLVILLTTVAWAISVLVHYPQPPPITAVGCALGGSLTLISRRQR
jgi:hypothetical protein